MANSRLSVEDTSRSIRLCIDLDGFIGEMDDRQRLALARELSCDDFIIQCVVDQIIQGFTDPEELSEGFSSNKRATEAARELIVASLPEFERLRENDVTDRIKQAQWHAKCDEGSRILNELYGPRGKWPAHVMDIYCNKKATPTAATEAAE